MATPSDWGFGIPTKPIGNTDLADIYIREGFHDLAFIHRLTPDQARSALVFLSGVEPEAFARLMSYLPTRHPEMLNHPQATVTIPHRKID